MDRFWPWGKQKELAYLVKTNQQVINAILHRKQSVGKERAVKLERASRLILKKPIPRVEWLYNKESKHPAFFGKPIKN